MPPKAHALLSASSSNRWIHCPPSVKLCSKYEDKESEYAEEGTQAHALCEYYLKQALGLKAENPSSTLSYYSEEMDDCASSYAAYVMKEYAFAKANCKDPLVLIEQQVDFSHWVHEGFGTADCIIVADGNLRIIDFKYGQGVMVDSMNNPQLMCYALGALSMFDDIYDIGAVNMTIYQPRRNNINACSMLKSDLLDWAEKVLKPAADHAFSGEGDFCSGEWCCFCKAKYECRARAEANLTMAKYDFKLPPLLDNAEIASILTQLDQLTAWADDLKEYALKEALNGREWPGWKLVEGRATRRYTNDSDVASIVEKAGFDPYEKKVLGITAMQKMLGKSRFDELLAAHLEKPKGKPTLVPESDKRQALNTVSEDFKEEK